MTAKKSRNDASAKDVLNRLSEPVAFFVGAGLSRDSQLPLFGELYGHILRSLLAETLSAKQIRWLLRTVRPEVTAQAITSIFGRRLFEFYDWFLQATPNSNHQFVALALKSGHAVITTNVDTLIEDACSRMGIGAELCVEDSDYESILSRRLQNGNFNSSGCLFKLRGSVLKNLHEEARYATIPLTVEDEAGGFTREKQAVFEHCIRERDMIVMGYAGLDHFSVHPMLRDTPSSKCLVWFQHEESNGWRQESGQTFEREIRIAREDIIDGVRDNTEEWSRLSMNEVLAARKHGVRLSGNVSNVLRQFVVDSGLTPYGRGETLKPPVPPWVLRVTKWQKHLLAGRLFRHARNLASGEEHCRAGLKATRRPACRAELLSELGNILLIPSDRKTNSKSADAFELASAAFSKGGETVKGLNARLDRANVFRRMRDYDRALELIEEVQREMKLLPRRCDSRDSWLIGSYAKSSKGLCYGMRDQENLRQIQRGVKICTEAVALARKSGHVRRLAAALNSEGLVRCQSAGDKRQLDSTRDTLQAAYQINRKLLAYRECYQPLRNLGLVHQQLSRLAEDDADRKLMLEEALASFVSAGNHIARITPIAQGESLEANFRIGETLVALGRFSDAKQTLSRVTIARAKSGDWHNEARAIQLLIRCSPAKSNRHKWISRVATIYGQVVSDEESTRRLKKDRVRRNNALDILKDCIELDSGLEAKLLRRIEEIMAKLQEK